MTVLVGGRVTSVTIAPDTSGLTLSLVPVGRLPSALVASAGYLGAALVGCLLMAATRVEKRARGILLALGIVMIFTVVVWMRNAFGIAVVLAWGVALVALARRGMGNAPRFLLSMLAIQVALNAVYDIRVLFLIDGGQVRCGDDGAARSAAGVAVGNDVDADQRGDAGHHAMADA